MEEQGKAVESVLGRLLDIASWHSMEHSKLFIGPHVNRTVAVEYLDAARSELSALRASHERMREEVVDLSRDPCALGPGTWGGHPILDLRMTHMEFDDKRRGWIIHGIGGCKECHPNPDAALSPPAPGGVTP